MPAIPPLGPNTPLLQAARSLGPSLSARSAEFEQLRQLPGDVSSSLVDLGVFRMWVPACFGGLELPVREALDVLAELAYWDGAVGWCSMIGVTTSLQAGFLQEPWASRLYASARGVTCGVAEPRGRARRVDGGLEVSGEWSWGSGTFHSDWIGGGCLIDPESEDARPKMIFAFFERDQVELLDTWHTSGLRGSGSTDFRVEKALVPRRRWVALGMDPPQVDAPLYRFPNLGALALGVSVVGLSMAARAIDEFRELAVQKAYVGSRRVLAERAGVQADVARCQAQLMASRAWIDAVVTEATVAASSGDVTLEHRRQLRMAATFGMQQAVQIVDTMFQAAGGAAVYETNPLQRLSRDIHVAATHGMVAPRTYEFFGRMGLGLKTKTFGL